jgi:hypothetical protein
MKVAALAGVDRRRDALLELRSAEQVDLSRNGDHVSPVVDPAILDGEARGHPDHPCPV